MMPALKLLCECQRAATRRTADRRVVSALVTVRSWASTITKRRRSN